MTMIQILSDGALSANWIMPLLAGVVAFFFVRTLNKMEARMNKHETQIGNITKIQVRMLSKLSADDATYEKMLDDLNKPSDE